VQGAILVAVCAAIALAVFLRVQRPFDRDTLDIQVSTLQSQASEAQLLADNSRGGQTSAGFVREHAQQMAHKVDAVNGKLRKSAPPELATELAAARKLGAALRGALLRLSRDGEAREDYGFDRMAQALGALHRQLKPADT
jgi:hypothetical protein